MNEAFLASITDSDESLLLLNMHFHDQLLKAIELIDNGEIQLYKYGKLEFYVVSNHLCNKTSCDCWKFKKSTEKASICQHSLAALLAEKLQIGVTTVTDESITIDLLQQFTTPGDSNQRQINFIQ